MIIHNNNNLEIYYGIVGKYINITNLILNIAKRPKKFYFPSDDNRRAQLFSDPCFGIVKEVLILYDNQIITIPADKSLVLDFQNFNFDIDTDLDTIKKVKTILKDVNLDINQKLISIHSHLQFHHGSLSDEFPEQKMSVSFLNENDKVLEIGGNVGRNSLIIASVLNNDKNLVVLECDSNIAKMLTENRNINNYSFHIESKALSKRSLIQKGWDTIPSDILLEGYQKVEIISFNDIQKNYDITFNTLVCDCEGALYYILKDDPEILKGIEKIIIENDFSSLEHKEFVDNLFLENNFKNVYTESLNYPQFKNRFPCYDYFFQVWVK